MERQNLPGRTNFELLPEVSFPNEGSYKVLHVGANLVNINNFICAFDHELFPSGTDASAAMQDDRENRGLSHSRYLALKRMPAKLIGGYLSDGKIEAS